jgi:hypothetical protein
MNNELENISICRIIISIVIVFEEKVGFKSGFAFLFFSIFALKAMGRE